VSFLLDIELKLFSTLIYKITESFKVWVTHFKCECNSNIEYI